MKIQLLSFNYDSLFENSYNIWKFQPDTIFWYLSSPSLDVLEFVEIVNAGIWSDSQVISILTNLYGAFSMASFLEVSYV